MISFENDYNTGAHPEVLKRLAQTNLEPLSGYGTDAYCESAKAKLREAMGMESADIEFLVGGTQTNAAVISAMLADYEGVVAADTGHVSMHEAGAIEFTGHKVLTLPHENGRLSPAALESYLDTFFADANHEHMVFPGMVYISHPTEFGTLYDKAQLKALSDICRRFGIPLYLDGARLAYGLMSHETDLTLRDIAELCDVFYVGGTKAGALCGEAVVFTRSNKPNHFMTSIKKRGALLAKGRLLGVQFDALFTDGLYYEIGRHAIEAAERLKAIFRSHGVRFYMDSPTNQQFVILENSVIEKLTERITVSFWERFDETHTVVRFVTSWSTTEDELTELDRVLTEILPK